MSIKYTTKIEFGQWKPGDVITFIRGRNIEPKYDIICTVQDNGKIVEIPTGDEIVPSEKWTDIIRLDYKFISDGTWFITGSEAYPTTEIDDKNNSWGAYFKGWTNEMYTKYVGNLPRWDGEVCLLDEFNIVKR